MSREEREFAVFGFASTHDALAAEALLKDAGLAVVPVPAPHELGALCGIALRLPPSDAGRARDVLVSASIQPTGEVAMSDV